MYIIRCPNCKIQLVLPDDKMSLCRCEHCNEVFERSRRTADNPENESADENLDISIMDKDVEILAERKRYLDKLTRSRPDEERTAERWQNGKRAAKFGFLLGLTAGVVSALLSPEGAGFIFSSWFELLAGAGACAIFAFGSVMLMQWGGKVSIGLSVVTIWGLWLWFVLSRGHRPCETPLALFIAVIIGISLTIFTAMAGIIIVWIARVIRDSFK